MDIKNTRIDFKDQNEVIESIRDEIRKIRPDNRIPSYYVRNFGCQMNENEAEKYTGILELMGFVPADDMKEADFVLFNTCCVRENAELRVFGYLGALKGLKNTRPWMLIALCGCMMEEPHVVEAIQEKYRHVDLVLGTGKIHELPGMLYDRLFGKERIVRVGGANGILSEGLPLKREHPFKSWVSIMYGCNNFCSYCIVPHVRGRERSRDIADILEEAKYLAGDGVKEITLLGQNVNSYGKHPAGQTDFTELLYRLAGIDGIKRIRFMTSHPKDISDSLIIAMSELDKVCKHLHLPMQAGSNRILQEMNRMYTKERYLAIVDFAKSKMPGLGLTTDIMVGFPGETEEDFLDTLDAVKKARFDMAFTFIYSKRRGTPAAEREDQIPDEEKKRRFQSLLAIQDAISLEKNNEMIGSRVVVLNEGPSKTNPGVSMGRTDTNKIVNFETDADSTGQFVETTIVGAAAWSLKGRLVGLNDETTVEGTVHGHIKGSL